MYKRLEKNPNDFYLICTGVCGRVVLGAWNQQIRRWIFLFHQ